MATADPVRRRRGRLQPGSKSRRLALVVQKFYRKSLPYVIFWAGFATDPALELQSLRQDAVGEFYRTSRILLKLASFLFVKILFPKFFLEIL